MASDQSIAAFVEALGSSAPAPGGGAASALAGALAAALAEMVARFTVGREKYRDVEERATAILSQAEGARATLLALAEDDARAYQDVSAAYRLPRASDEERAAREEAIQAALASAMQPPLRAVRAACATVGLAAEIAAIGNGTVISDAGCAALLGEAAARAAALNVLANATLLRDAALADGARAEVRALLAEAQAQRDRAFATTLRRMGVEALS
ncbi:MAG TPA: cyclodeaminase/cyclohydrolase family protein [Ktedonobacterales bacterium]|nr:cyclodeaminase/cyclohydrolase family protein [Ktedonobacterales bacterium]